MSAPISPFVPPTFEQLKDSIRETLLGQLADQRLAKLRSDAKVVTNSPDGNDCSGSGRNAACREAKPIDPPGMNQLPCD